MASHAGDVKSIYKGVMCANCRTWNFTENKRNCDVFGRRIKTSKYVDTIASLDRRRYKNEN